MLDWREAVFGDLEVIESPFMQVRRVGIATESGVQEAGEVDRGIGLDPGGEGADPIEDRLRSLPLLGQVPEDVGGPLGIDDLSLVVDVEEHSPGMC